MSLCRPAKHLKASEAKTKMRVRKRTSRSRDSQNPPDKTPFPTRPRGAPPRNCALFMKAEVRVSLVVELVPERVEEVLRIVYLQGSSVSQKPGRQRDVLATAFQCIFPLSLRRARPDPVHCHRRVLCPHLWATLGIEADGSMAFSSVQFSSVAQSCPTLCDPMDCSTPGFPVHQLPELAQTHVHRVDDAIQPSHPLPSPSPPVPNLSQHQGLFQEVSSSQQVGKVLEFQLQQQSFQWSWPWVKIIPNAALHWGKVKTWP